MRVFHSSTQRRTKATELDCSQELSRTSVQQLHGRWASVYPLQFSFSFFTKLTKTLYRRQYNHIRNRTSGSGTCVDSPLKTPGSSSKRGYEEAFSTELEDDDDGRLIKQEDECERPLIKTETVVDGVIILDDDDDLYSAPKSIKKKVFTSRPGFMKPQGPRPPSPPPPPPRALDAFEFVRYMPVPARPQFTRPTSQGNRPPSPPPPPKGLYQVEGEQELTAPAKPPQRRSTRPAPHVYRPPSPPPPPEGGLGFRRGLP